MWVVIDANFQAKPSFIFDIKRIVSHSLDFESFACVYKQLLTIEFSNTLISVFLSHTYIINIMTQECLCLNACKNLLNILL